MNSVPLILGFLTFITHNSISSENFIAKKKVSYLKQLVCFEYFEIHKNEALKAKNNLNLRLS